MFDGVSVARILLVSVSLSFIIKACWHSHELSEILNAADIAGLSDGRCTLTLLADVAKERKKLLRETLVSMGLASAAVIMATILYCYFD